MTTHPLTEYLEALHANLVWGDCAGKKARVSNLQQNRLVKEDSLFELTQKLFSITEFNKKTKVFRKSLGGTFPFSLRGNQKVTWSERKIKPMFSDFIKRARSPIDVGKYELMEMFRTYRNQIEEIGKDADDMDEEILRPGCSLQQEIEYSTTEEHNPFGNRIEHKLHLTLGQPGFGKTIHLQQFAEQEVRKQRTHVHPRIPLFMKATHLASAIDNIATGRGGIWIEPSTKEEAQHHEYKFAIDVDEIVSTIGQAMLLWNPVFGEFVSELHNEFEKEENKFMLIVDALDECDEEALLNVAAFLENFRARHGNVIASCRYSHREVFENISGILSGDRRHPHIIPYHLDFTPSELRHDMPMKLANAWGIRGNRLGIIINQDFEKYQSVLTHPLFVGFFARLVVEEWDELPDTLSKAQLDARFLGEYNFLHISFLMNVINRGIELAIEERHKSSGVDVNRIHDLFEAFAFVSLSENSKNINQIVKCIKSMGEFKPTTKEINILKKGVGLLYSSDQIHADWVHKTIAEVGCGMYLFKHPKFGTEDLLSLQCTGLTFMFLNSQATQQETIGGILRGIHKKAETQHLALSLVAHFEEYKAPLFSGIKWDESGLQPQTYILAKEFENNELAQFIHHQTKKLGSPKLPYQNFLNCVDDALRWHRMIPLSLDEMTALVRNEMEHANAPVRFSRLSSTYPYNQDFIHQLAKLAMTRPPEFIVEWIDRHLGPTPILYFALVESVAGMLIVQNLSDIESDFNLNEQRQWLDSIIGNYSDFIIEYERELETLAALSTWLDQVLPKGIEAKLKRLMVLQRVVYALGGNTKEMTPLYNEVVDKCPARLKLAIEQLILPTMRGEG